MLEFIPEDSRKLIKINRRSTRTDNQIENYFCSNIFTNEITDESTEYSGESDEDDINTTPHTSSFKTIPTSRWELSFSYLK